MKKIWKRSLSLFLAFVMVFGMLPVSTFADETEPVVTEETFAAEAVAAEVTETPTEEPTEPVTEAPVEETTAPVTEAPVEITVMQSVSDEAVNSEAEATEATEPELQWVTLDSGAYTGDFPSNDELFAAYADHIWFGTDIATFGTHAADRLNADTRTVYDALVPFLKDIAAGNRDSAMIAIGTSLNDTYKAEAEVTFDFNNLSAKNLLGALLADMPYEMYWQDKTLGISVRGASYDGIDWLYYFYFAVATNYNTGNYEPFEFTDSEGNKYTKDICYTVDTSKIDKVTTTAAIAQSVVDDIAADADVKTDYDKLVAYKNWICQQVSYNQNAADGNPTFSENLDPWQVIYVFDGDPSTNVVCEGYSKAFQYLCDLAFSKADPAEETVTCYSVTGSLVGVGDHMWNIVEIDDNCYLADITNSDQGSAGENGSLFLVGGTADSNGVYTFSTLAQGGSSSFAYDEDTLDLWGDSGILTLSATNYEPPAEVVPGTMSQADFETALAKAAGGTYTLTSDVTLTKDMTLPCNVTVADGATLTIADGTTLTVAGYTLTVCSDLYIQEGGRMIVENNGWLYVPETDPADGSDNTDTEIIVDGKLLILAGGAIKTYGGPNIDTPPCVIVINGIMFVASNAASYDFCFDGNGLVIEGETDLDAKLVFYGCCNWGNGFRVDWEGFNTMMTMEPGDGRPGLFCIREWDAANYEFKQTVIDPDDLTVGDHLTVFTWADDPYCPELDESDPFVNQIANIQAQEGAWDKQTSVSYTLNGKTYSFPIRLERPQTCAFYSEPTASNETYLGYNYTIDPEKSENSFYFIFTSKEDWTVVPGSFRVVDNPFDENSMADYVTWETISNTVYKITIKPDVVDALAASGDALALHGALEAKDSYGYTMTFGMGQIWCQTEQQDIYYDFHGFYTTSTASQETMLYDTLMLDPDAAENAFYYILTNPDFTVVDGTFQIMDNPADRNPVEGVSYQKISDTVYKIIVSPEKVAELDTNGGYLPIFVELDAVSSTDGYTGSYGWGQLRCYVGGEMTQAEFAAALAANAGTNYVLTKSVTITEDMTVRMATDAVPYNHSVKIPSGVTLTVANGATLTTETSLLVDDGTLVVENGSKLALGSDDRYSCLYLWGGTLDIAAQTGLDMSNGQIFMEHGQNCSLPGWLSLSRVNAQYYIRQQSDLAELENLDQYACADIYVQCDLVIDENLALTHGENLYVHAPNSLTVSEGVTLTLGSNNMLYIGEGAAVNNNGTILCHGYFNNYGTLNGNAVEFGSSEMDEADLLAALNDSATSGTPYVLNQKVTLTAATVFPSGAQLHIVEGGRLTVSSGVHLSNLGDIQVNGGKFILLSGSAITSTGFITINSGIMFFANGVTYNIAGMNGPIIREAYGDTETQLVLYDFNDFGNGIITNWNHYFKSTIVTAPSMSMNGLPCIQEWDSANYEWNIIPVDVADLTAGDYLTIQNWVGPNFSPDEPNADKFVSIRVADNAIGHTSYVSCNYNGTTYTLDFRFEIPENCAFYSGPEATEENYLGFRYSIDPHKSENYFYFIFTKPGWNVVPGSFAVVDNPFDQNAVDEVTWEQISDSVYKITIKPEVVEALCVNGDSFPVHGQVEATHPDGFYNRFGMGQLWCEAPLPEISQEDFEQALADAAAVGEVYELNGNVILETPTAITSEIHVMDRASLTVSGNVLTVGSNMRARSTEGGDQYGHLIADGGTITIASDGGLDIADGALVQVWNGGTLNIEEGADIEGVQPAEIWYNVTHPGMNTVNGIDDSQLGAIINPHDAAGIEEAFAKTDDYAFIGVYPVVESGVLELDRDITIPEGDNLNLLNPVALKVPAPYTLTNNGSIDICADSRLEILQGATLVNNEYSTVNVDPYGQLVIRGTIIGEEAVNGSIVWGEMSHEDLMAVIENCEENDSSWVHESETILETGVNGGVLQIAMGEGPAFYLDDGGVIRVPAGCTLKVFNPLILTGGKVIVEAGGTLDAGDGHMEIREGVIYAEQGANVIDNGHIRGRIAWEGNTDPWLSETWLDNWEEGWFINPENEIHEANGLHVMDSHWRIYFLNTWDAENLQWNRVPVIPTENSNYMTITRIMDMEDQFIRGDQEYAEYFVCVDVFGTMEHQSVNLFVNGVPYAYELFSRTVAFYSAPEISMDTLISGGHHQMDAAAEENAVYWLVKEPEYFDVLNFSWNLETRGEDYTQYTGGDPLVTLDESQAKQGIYKFVVDPDFVNYAQYDYKNFNLRIHMELDDNRDGENNINIEYWDRDVWIDPPELLQPAAVFGINNETYLFYDTGKVFRDCFAGFDQEGHEIWKREPSTLNLSYIPAENRLILDTVDLTALSIHYGYSWTDENGNEIFEQHLPNENLTITLVGSSSIINHCGPAVRISNGTNVTINGNGSLYAKTTNYPDFREENGNHQCYDTINVHDGSSLTIGGNVTITAEVDGHGYRENDEAATNHAFSGSHQGDTLVITDNATVTTVVPNGVRHYDVTGATSQIGGYVGIENFNTITVSGGELNTDYLNFHDGGEFNLTGGVVNLRDIGCMEKHWQTGETIYHYEGIRTYGGSVNISGGELNIDVSPRDGESADQTNAYGINAIAGAIDISGGIININTGISDGWAILADCDWTQDGWIDGTESYFSITGGTINILSDPRTYHGGILISEICGGYFGGGEINDDYGVHRFYGNTVWGDGENGGGTVLKGVATNVYTHGPGEFYMFDGQMDLIGDVFEENGETVTNRAIFEANGSGALFGGKINLVNGSYRNNMNITLNGAEITINNDVADLPGLENYLYFPIYSGSLNITANGPAIINNGTFHQMGGEVYAESTLGTRPVMISTGRTLLNAGSLNLQGHGGVGLVQAYDFDLAADDIENNESGLFMGAMDENQPCLNISGTQIGLYLNGPAVIVDGANVDIQVEGTPINADRDWPMAIYVEKHTGNLDLSGNNVSGLAISGGANVNLVSKDTAGVDAMSKGIVAWYAPVEIDGYTDEDTGAYIAPNVTIDAEMALYSMTDSAEASNLTISDDILSLTTGKKLEITGSAFEGGYLYSVKEDDNTYAGHVIITKAAVVSDLATLKSHMVEENGRWVLTKPVTIEGSFALENIIIDVANGGKLNIAEDVTLTISADSHLIAQENGTILVDGTIVNNGTMAADNGGIITFCSEESYVHGQQGSVLTVHYRNGSLSTIDGISLSHQTLHADVDSVDQIHYILGLENRAGYGKIDININTDMTLTSLTIPENVELFVNDATVTFTELIANYGGITSNFANGLVQIEGILNNYCSVNINNASTMEINGTLNNWQWFNVGYWKDASVEDTAGTLNINGTFNNYNYLNISPDAYIETEDRYCGGIVNVNEGGLLNNTFHQEKELYGFIELHGELNIHGTLMNGQQIVQYGSLYVYGNVDNGGSIRLFDKDFETGNDLELVTYEGAEIVNDTMIGNLSTNGVIVLAPDTYIQGSTNYDDGTSEPGELDARCFDDLTMSRIEGAPEGTVSIFYEGSNADALLAAAELYKANRNAYDRCFLRVVGDMTIPEGMNLNLIPGSYLVVLNNGNTDPNMAPVYAGSLTVEGQIFNLGYIRLFGADMTIPQSGWITNKGIIDTNMMPNEKPTVTVGGLLENASTATLDLSNADFRLEEGGVMQNNLAGENLGDMIGVEISDQTLFSDIDSGDQAQLQQLIDKVQNDGYRHGCFWISSDLFILSNTVIPDNITLYIRPGVSLTNIDPGVILENNGRIIVEAGGQLDTNGNLYVKQEGIVDVYGSMTINAYGYVGLDANASLNVMNGGTLTVNGYFEVGEGTLNVAGGTVNNYATTVVSYPNGTVNGNVSRLILYMPINDAVDVEAKIQALQAYAQANGFAKTQIHFLCDYTFEAGFTVPQNMNLIIGAYGGEDRYTAATVTIPAGQTLTINGNVQVAQKSALILEDGADLVCNGSIYAFGSCGTNATWVLSNDVLTISGSGDMFDYAEDSAPWAGCASLIKSVKIGSSITGIGDNAFGNISVNTILVPKSVASVGENAFASGVTLKVYHNTAAESYAENNGNTIVYIHELDPETGACLGCNFGLEATLKDETKTTVEKVEEVKNTDTETLKTQIEQEIAQNTDGNSNTMDLIENLEKELLQDETTDLTVSAGVAENTDEVITTVFENVSDEVIVGAALNAAPDVSEVKLVISNPSGQNEVSEEYDTETGVLFSMTLEGVEDASTLDVPVKITLPVPAGINDLSKLVVLHYHDGQTEALNYTLSTGEDGKTYVTFLVSGFSDFAIVEEASVVEEVVEIAHYGQNLRLQDLIKIGYYFTVTTDATVEEVGALLWTEEQYNSETNFTVDSSNAKIYGNLQSSSGYYIVETDGIYAQNLGDTYYMIPYARTSSGYTYGAVKPYKALDYIQGVYAKESSAWANVRSLVIDLVNYGTAAREYFCIVEGLETPDEPFNSFMSAEDQTVTWDSSLAAAYPAVSETGSFTSTLYGRNVNLLDAISAGMYFTNGDQIDGAYYWDESTYTANSIHDSTTKSGDALIEDAGSGYVKASVTGLFAYNIYDNYYVRVHNADGALSDTYGISVAGYLTAAINAYGTKTDATSQSVVSLCKAMLVYGDNARNNPSINK